MTVKMKKALTRLSPGLSSSRRPSKRIGRKHSNRKKSKEELERYFDWWFSNTKI